jgi:hypothetical protein
MRRACKTWRADDRAVPVLLSTRAAAGALLAAGYANVCVFSARAPPAPAEPPLPLAPGELRVVTLPLATTDPHLRFCGGAVLELDPALAALHKLSDAARKVLVRTRCAVACDWWPGNELLAELASLFFERRVLPPARCVSLPPAAAERLRHACDSGASRELVRRAARAGAPKGPAGALAAARRAAFCVDASIPHDEARVLLLTDGKARAAASARLTGVLVVELAELLERGPSEAIVDGGPWCVVFAVECLVEYTERLVLWELARASVRVSRVVTHVWTPDGDTARLEGRWAAGPEDGAAERALTLMHAQ